MAHGTYDNPRAGTNSSKIRMKNLTDKVNGNVDGESSKTKTRGRTKTKTTKTRTLESEGGSKRVQTTKAKKVEKTRRGGRVQIEKGKSKQDLGEGWVITTKVGKGDKTKTKTKTVLDKSGNIKREKSKTKLVDEFGEKGTRRAKSKPGKIYKYKSIKGDKTIYKTNPGGKSGVKTTRNKLGKITSRENYGKKYPTTVAGAKRELRKNPNATADKIGVEGFKRDTKKYDRLVRSRAFQKSEAKKAGKTLRQHSTDAVKSINTSMSLANNPGRMKVGVFGKAKEDKKATRKAKK